MYYSYLFAATFTCHATLETGSGLAMGTRLHSYIIMRKHFKHKFINKEEEVRSVALKSEKEASNLRRWFHLN